MQPSVILIAAAAALGVAVIVGIDPRWPVALGLTALAASGLFITLGDRALANLLATIAFFTMGFGTLLALIELARSTRTRHRDRSGSRVEGDPLVEGNED